MKAVNPPPKGNDGHGQSEAQVPAIAQFLLQLTRSRRQDSLSIVHKISAVDAFGRPTCADLPGGSGLQVHSSLLNIVLHD